MYREETFVFHYWCVSEWDWLFNVTFNDISVMWRHIYRCAGRPKKKLDLRSGSHAIDISQVSRVRPSTYTTTNLFTVIQRNRPISIVFYDAHEDTEDLFSSLPPGSPQGTIIGRPYRHTVDVFKNKQNKQNDVWLNQHIETILFSLIIQFPYANECIFIW